MIPLAFIIVASHDLSGQIIEDIEKYIDPSASLLVALETALGVHTFSDGQHYHIFVDMTMKQYDSFRKTILVNKMRLQGQAKNGIGRQYGIVRKIRDESKMLQYTVKDNNIYFRNFDLKKIQDAILESYHSKSPKEFLRELMLYLLQTDYSLMDTGLLPGVSSPEIDFKAIELNIIAFYVQEQNGRTVSNTQLKSLTQKFLMYNLPMDESLKINTIHFHTKNWK